MKWERVHGRAGEMPDGRQLAAGRKDGTCGPGRRWGHTCNAVHGGRFLYVFGGYGEDNCQTNEVHIFDSVKQSWSKPIMKGVPPSPRDSHTCTAVGNKLFVFGGTDGANPLKNLHILDISSNTWISPSIRGKGPDGREGHTAALVDKRLFIFGGCGKSRDNPEEIYYNDLYILDTEKLEWERAVTSGDAPSARDSHTCSAWGNKLIILGGEDASDYYLSDVYILNTDTLVWTELNTSGQMLAPRAGHATVALGRNLFVFGGFTDARNLYDDLHVLNVDTGIWSRVANVNPGPSARFSAAGDCLDAHSGILVFIGGCNESLEALDDMYYLHTGMPLENGKPHHRREKLSLRKELKRKCQENFCPTSTAEMNNNNNDMHKLGMTPISSRPVIPDSSFDPWSVGEKTFQAVITGGFPHGYTVETYIDGRLLRGIIFSQQPNPSRNSDASINKKRITSSGGPKLNDRQGAEVKSTKTNHQLTARSSPGPTGAVHSIEPTGKESAMRTNSSSDKVVSAADANVLLSLKPSVAP